MAVDWWIQHVPQADRPGALLSGHASESVARFVGSAEDLPGYGEVLYPADSEDGDDSGNLVVIPLAPGTYEQDGLVPVLVGESGRISMGLPPTELSDEGRRVILGDAPAELDQRVDSAQVVAGNALERASTVTDAYNDLISEWDEIMPTLGDDIMTAQDVADALTARVDEGLVRVAPESDPPTVAPGLTWLVVDGETGTQALGLKVADAAGAGWVSAQVFAEDVLVVGPTGQVRLRDGVVTADTLASRIVLASEIIAGDSDGTYAVMDPQGFHVLRAQPEGDPAEVVRLGVAGEGDFLTVASDEGDALAAIDGDGVITGAALEAEGDVNADQYLLAGEDAETWVSEMAMRPVVQFSPGPEEFGTGGDTYLSGGAERLILDMAWENEDTEPHQIWVPPLPATVVALGSGSVLLNWRMTTDGTTPNRDSTTVASGRVATSASQYANLTVPAMSRTVEPGAVVQFLLTGQHSQGHGFRFPYRIRPQLFDLGRAVEVEGAWNVRSMSLVTSGGSASGSSTAKESATKKRYRRTWTVGWAASYYHGTGARNSGFSGKAAQGSYTGAANGRMKGLLGFSSANLNDIASELSGATIEKVEAYVYFSHWWNNSGGTFGLGVHGYSTAPASWGAAPTRLVTGKTAKPGGRWVRLPASTHAGFKSGANKGFTLSSSGNGVSEYGYATSRKLRITYRK